MHRLSTCYNSPVCRDTSLPLSTVTIWSVPTKVSTGLTWLVLLNSYKSVDQSWYVLLRPMGVLSEPVCVTFKSISFLFLIIYGTSQSQSYSAKAVTMKLLSLRERSRYFQIWLPKYCKAGTPRTSRSTIGPLVNSKDLQHKCTNCIQSLRFVRHLTFLICWCKMLLSALPYAYTYWMICLTQIRSRIHFEAEWFAQAPVSTSCWGPWGCTVENCCELKPKSKCKMAERDKYQNYLLQVWTFSQNVEGAFLPFSALL